MSGTTIRLNVQDLLNNCLGYYRIYIDALQLVYNTLVIDKTDCVVILIGICISNRCMHLI